LASPFRFLNRGILKILFAHKLVMGNFQKEDSSRCGKFLKESSNIAEPSKEPATMRMTRVVDLNLLRSGKT